MASSKQLPTTSRPGAYGVLSVPAGGAVNFSGQTQVVERIVCYGTAGTLELSWPGGGLSQPMVGGAPITLSVLGRYDYAGTFSVDCSGIAAGETIVEFVSL